MQKSMHEPPFGTAEHFCEVVVYKPKLRLSLFDPANFWTFSTSNHTQRASSEMEIEG